MEPKWHHLDSSVETLVCAVMSGSVDLVAFLVQLSQTPSPYHPHGDYRFISHALSAALVAASRTGRDDMIELLLAQGVSVNALVWYSTVGSKISLQL